MTGASRLEVDDLFKAPRGALIDQLDLYFPRWYEEYLTQSEAIEALFEMGNRQVIARLKVRAFDRMLRGVYKLGHAAHHLPKPGAADKP